MIMNDEDSTEKEKGGRSSTSGEWGGRHGRGCKVADEEGAGCSKRALRFIGVL
jgi:hypothetical protein